MRNKQYPFLFLFFLAFFVTSVPTFAGITFNQNQAKIVIAPTCKHVPISVPYVSDDASYNELLIAVSSDSDWAIPAVNSESDRIEISFATENLIASYTATITVDDGEKVTELFIQSRVPPLDIYRLLDDPLRSVTYGIQKDGIDNGSIIAFDPVQGSFISCITVGDSPTDFAINDDNTELLVINSVGKSIDVIDLETFSLKETINLPEYSVWGDAGETAANIGLGPDDIIYYTDGEWGPVLHTLKRSTGEVLQSILFDGSSPSNDTGFMDFAVTSDKTRMVAMPQYGWSAGVHSSVVGHYTINGDGTVNFVKETSLSSFSREPFEAPVLLSEDDQIAVMKTISTDPANTDNLDREFPSAIWSMNPNASVVATGDKLYEYETGIALYTIPGGSIGGSEYLYTKAQAFTSDFTRFVYFNSSDRTLNVVNLIDEIGLELLGRALNPQDGSVVNSPDTLTWAPLVGVDQYDLYLCADVEAITIADNTSSCYLGRVTGTTFALVQTLNIGSEYFWRIDPVTAQGSETGIVYSFSVSDISLDINKIDAQTVTGHADYQADIQLVSEEPGVSWTASAADTWVTFTDNAGSTPSTLSVHLDATMLARGFHNSTVTLTSASGEVRIPVQFQVDPLNVTHIRSDRNSAITYAISEDTGSVISQAYLLEIDSTTELIQRVIPVGSSVTDFTIHYADNLIYVTNWESGNLLAIDKSTFEHLKSIAFQPAGATGYSAGDVYRVAAGVSQRLVVEEQDQWVDISIINTQAETELNQASVREGGGAFDPTGRYYYHGENNSSGASILKFDTSGDTFTSLAEVRPPEISSYYGSRNVIVSEDGSRIFWAGVVL
ncbi:MAG: DNA-binding beta-propeller fold protein YncE, partial [Paraglaciecola sp.]